MLYAKLFADRQSRLLAGRRLLAWAERMAALGHGKPSELTPQRALEIAGAATPANARAAEPANPAGREPGRKITVTPVGIVMFLKW